MDAKFSPRVKDVISYSREEALRLGHDYIGVEHLLLGIIREGSRCCHQNDEIIWNRHKGIKKKIRVQIRIRTT